MIIRQFTCFGNGDAGGNPALVIEDAPAGEAERSALAREHGLTCVFIDPPGASGAATLDFVYPHMRSPLCLHATLAAAEVLFAREGAAAPLMVTTAMRGQPLLLARDGGTVFVRLARQAAPQVAVDGEVAARLLAAPGLALASAPGIASVGSPKLLLEVADAATLHGLQPDLALIHDWGKAQGISGCYVWCRLGENEVEGRNFNHLDPRLEDRATGVAAGALTALLGHGLLLRQGRASGSDCLIRTALDGDAVLVGGRVRAEPHAVPSARSAG